METAEAITKTRWDIDTAHSEIGFRVKHLVFSNVRGNFSEFDARIFTNGNDFTSAQIDLSINPASIDTRVEARNQHLRSADFFDTEQYKEIRFISNALLATEQEGRFRLEGELTMKGVKNPITLEAEFGGVIKDPWGKEKALFTVSGKINRKDWGLNYNAALEAGGVLISEDVWIHCETQLIKEA